jgi:hypothetical protein
MVELRRHVKPSPVEGIWCRIVQGTQIQSHFVENIGMGASDGTGMNYRQDLPAGLTGRTYRQDLVAC